MNKEYRENMKSMINRAMVLPVIHLNGDRAETLMEQALNAYRALQAADAALAEATPNGRNYYCSKDGDRTQAARDEHWSRREKVQEMAAEMLALAEHCQKFVKE